MRAIADRGSMFGWIKSKALYTRCALACGDGGQITTKNIYNKNFKKRKNEKHNNSKRAINS